MKDKRSHFQIRVAAAKRLFMWHFLNKRLGLVLITEFPKSGGSWFAQMISEALQIPFPRNKAPKFETCIMHGHHLYHANFGKTIAIMRDGRDIMVSAYYHLLFENDRNPPQSIVKHRSKVPFDNYEDIKTNLPAFIKYMFEDYAEGKTHFNWSEAVNSYFDNPKVCIVKYENLLKDAAGELKKAIQFLGKKTPPMENLKTVVENFSFKKLTKRKQGQENKKSFLRKGIAGDWKNKFTEKSCEVFDHYAGKELLKAGYEKDHSWIKNYLSVESY